MVGPAASRYAFGSALCALLTVLAACADDDDTADGARSSGDARDAGVEVIEVVDGDTVRVRVDGTEERLRLVGVDAPEVGECLAQDASNALEQLLAGGPIRLEADSSDRDRYGRLLRYVHVGDRFVNAELIEAGLAIARSYPPDVARDVELEQAQRVAQRAGVGIWAPDACGPRSDASVAIVAIEADPPGDDVENLNGEFVEIHNEGTEDVELTGWVLRDESAAHRFAFPDGFVVPAGATVRVRTGCGRDTPTELHWCESGSAVWNNDGDTAFVLDASGNIVASRAYVPD